MLQFFAGVRASIFSKRARQTERLRKPAARRLRLEPLEDRQLLSVDLISAAYGASTGGNGQSSASSINNDGRHVAFQSDATDLVLADTNGFTDVFLRDATAATTSLVSTNTSGTQGNGASTSASISGDGQLVAFVSAATNLVASDSNGVDDIFVKNVTTGAVLLVSADSSGNQANGKSSVPAISRDGRFVAFVSEATNLVPNDTNGVADVFVKNLATGAIVRANTDSSGNQANGDAGSTTGPSISSDGRCVAFGSIATNLVMGDSNGTSDIFVKDLLTGVTTRVSTDSAGNQGTGSCDAPSISGDGRYVAFESTRDVVSPTWSYGGIFVKDQATGITVRVVSNFHFGRYVGSRLSADGRYIAFELKPYQLVGDHLYVKDLVTGSSIEAGASPTGYPSISGDGRFVAYHTASMTFTPPSEVYRASAQFPPPAPSTIGLYDPSSSLFLLRNSNTTGSANQQFGYGAPAAGWLPIAGDWDGDGIATVGLYDPVLSKFYLRNSNTVGAADVQFAFGAPGAGWLPIAGRWSGRGPDTVGLYDPHTGTFYLSGNNTNANADLTFSFGATNAGWLPVMGDWDGDGSTTAGLYDPSTSTFYLRNTNTTGMADTAFGFGAAGAGWKPIAGDWTGAGSEAIGLYASDTSTVYLRNTNTAGMADTAFGYGAPGAGWLAIAGNWIAAGAGLNAESGMPRVENGMTPAASLAPSPQSLAPLVAEALARWIEAGVTLASPQLVVTDLPGNLLGEAAGNTIYLDQNAAGYGWFIDSTPSTDEEFAFSAGSRSLHAIDARAVDHIDLLTVIEHELGHIAGLSDLDASATSLMSGTLPTGVRRSR